MTPPKTRWRVLHAPVLLFSVVFGMWLVVHIAHGTPQGALAGRVGALEWVMWVVSAGSFAVLCWLLIRESGKSQHHAHLADALAHEVLDTTPDALMIVGPDNRIVRANVAMLEVTGLSPILVIGHPLSDVAIRDEEGRPVSWPEDGPFRARVGSAASLLDIDIVVREMKGMPGYRLVHIRNITPELNDLRLIKQQECQLELLTELGTALNRVTSEEALLELAVDQLSRRIPIVASGGVFIIDRPAAVLRLVATVGLEPGFVAAEREVPLGECLCGQVALSGESRYSASASGDQFHTRHRATKPHGHIVLPLRTESEVIGVLFLYLREHAELECDLQRVLEGVASEIGLALMRVREHTALKQSERNLEMLFEEAPDAMLVADKGGVASRVNRRARRWFTLGEVVKERLPWDAMLTMGGNGISPSRTPLSDGAGRQSMVEITGSAVGAGNVQFILRDVTREVMLERQAREFQNMEVVGALAAGLAHNLNNIFASVLAHLFQLREIAADDRGIDLTARGGDLEYARRHLAAAIGGAEQVSVLIERLLELARPRAPELEVFDLGRLLQEQIELAKPLLGPLISLRTNLPGGVHVRADRSILGNALMNLLLNAAQAMSKKGELQVGVGEHTAEAAWFEVHDNGIGMDEATRARIFEPFFTTKQAGTGLGLSTLHAGITSLGGRVEVESSPGCGSTFRVFLPQVSRPVKSEGESIGAQKRRILLAEDAPVLRDFTVRHLQESGWEVRAVGSARELRAAARAWRPEVAVVDWNLGDGNAAGAIEELRELGSAVIVLSGDPAGVDRSDVPVLSKPVDWDRLEEYLRHVQR